MVSWRKRTRWRLVPVEADAPGSDPAGRRPLVLRALRETADLLEARAYRVDRDAPGDLGSAWAVELLGHWRMLMVELRPAAGAELIGEPPRDARRIATCAPTRPP
jgi:hypothetical protein